MNFPKTIKLTVTNKDFNKAVHARGRRLSPVTHCPISQALNRLFNRDNSETGLTSSDVRIDCKRAYYNLSQEASRLIDLYDKRKVNSRSFSEKTFTLKLRKVVDCV